MGICRSKDHGGLQGCGEIGRGLLAVGLWLLAFIETKFVDIRSGRTELNPRVKKFIEIRNEGMKLPEQVP
jgi:hypothetical protein